MDNFYTSPALFFNILEKRTHACGTSRSRKGLPKKLLDKKTQSEGGYGCIYVHRKSKNNMIAIKIYDRKVVTLLSTIHNATLQTTGRVYRNTGEAIKKSEMVLAYNKSTYLNRMGSSEARWWNPECINTYKVSTIVITDYILNYIYIILYAWMAYNRVKVIGCDVGLHPPAGKKL